MPLLTLLAPCVLGPGTLLLRYKPPVGEAHRYAFTTILVQDIGRPKISKQVTTYQLVVKALASAQGLSSVESSYTNGRADMPANKWSPATSRPLPAMSMLSRIDDRLRVIDTKPSGRTIPGMVPYFLRQMDAITPFCLPGEPVKLGATWKTKYDFDRLVGATAMSGLTTTGQIPYTMTLAKVTPTSVTVAISMGGSATASGQGLKTTFAINGTGTAVLDRTTGVLRSISVKMDTKISTGGGSSRQTAVQTIKQI